MKFWGTTVKPGQRVKVEIGGDDILHLSQVSLGEIKKDKSNQNVHVKLFLHGHEGEDLVLSTLIPDKLPQQQLDLVFSKGFEVSHNWENGTVFFYGYRTPSPFMDEDDDDFDSDESESDEENFELLRPDNEGKPDLKAKEPEKPAETKKAKAASESGSGKQKVKIVEPSSVKIDDDDSSDEDDLDDGSTDEDEDDSDSEELNDSDDSDSEEEETPKKKEETPKKVQSAKKRDSTSAPEITETPQVKKAKLITPQKTVDAESKKSSVHVATPYPKAGKTPAVNKNQQTPKSAGSHSCKSCNKTFNSEAAIASHNKAKHSAGK